MHKIVVDSSVIVKWLTTQNEQLLEQAGRILEDAKDGKVVLTAPELSRYELGNALLKKKIGLFLALDALTVSHALPVVFVIETPDLAIETYQIAEATGITYYDASFMALAKQEKATLVTDNPKHQKKAKGIKVIPLENYH